MANLMRGECPILSEHGSDGRTIFEQCRGLCEKFGGLYEDIHIGCWRENAENSTLREPLTIYCSPFADRILKYEVDREMFMTYEPASS